MLIPATVPPHKRDEFHNNYATLTKDTSKLLLFVADQKMQSLNEEFFGPDLPAGISDPEHIFKIASQSNVGGLSVHLGLMSRYGQQYSNINFVPKLDGKTNLTPTDPYSQQIWSVADAVDVARNGNMKLCGVGYTVYVGSEYEREMLTEAATTIKEAHAHGLVTILWMYPRGHKVKNPYDPNIIAGVAGLGATLGADFVKITEPDTGPHDLIYAVQAAGNTKVLVAGGPARSPEQMIKRVEAQLSYGTAGAVIGRNIFQHPLKEAITIANNLAETIYQHLDEDNFVGL